MLSRQSRRSLPGRAALILALALALLAPQVTPAADGPPASEILVNGLLSAGTAGQPASWAKASYAQTKGSPRFGWSVGATGIGVLSIENVNPDDSHWTQTATVTPETWYLLRGWVRTENVGATQRGAGLSVMESFYDSQDLRGTQDWTPLSLWIRTAAGQTTLEVACRLGGYSSLTTGQAWFTALSLQPSGPPPEGASFVHGGVPVAREEGSAVWVQVVAALVVVALALLVWRYVLPPSTHVPP